MDSFRSPTKRLNTFFTVTGCIVLLIFPALCFIILEYMHFSNKSAFFSFVAARSGVIFFDLICVYLIFSILIIILKRARYASVIFGFFIILVAVTNYYKRGLTGDYFYPWDILQTPNIPILIGYINFSLPVLYIFFLICIVVAIILICIPRISVPFKWYIRVPLVLLLAGAAFFAVSTPARVSKLLNNNGLFLEDMALQQSNYDYNGFTAATIVNILSGQIQKPADYSKQAVTDLLEKYKEIPVSADYKYPDIIIILSESYWDIRSLPGTEFSADPLKNFDDIVWKNNSYGGKFYTTGFGGGTIRPEFELVTGLTTDSLPDGCIPYQYIHAGFDSYITIYKKLGYNTKMLHPYLPSFYMRDKKLGYLGFDELYFNGDLLEINEITPSLVAGNISDGSFMEYIEYFLKKSSDAPTLIFGITMANHQPYINKYASEELAVKISNPDIDAETIGFIEQYTQGVIDADNSLKKLTEYIDGRDKPTVLVFFGDHAPSLGVNNAAYYQSGFTADICSPTIGERNIMQSTPFLIHSNYDLDLRGGDYMLKQGGGNNIASYNLLNALAELIGSPRTKFMGFLKDYYNVHNNYNIRLNIPVSPELSGFINGHVILTYDRIKGMKYSLP